MRLDLDNTQTICSQSLGFDHQNTENLLMVAPDVSFYQSTLYVGVARAVSPTNTNFRLTFLLTRLQEALYEDLAV